MTENRRAVGGTYERSAAAFFKRKGYRILAQNFHTRYAEIDLIAQEGGTVVFAEVKYRSDARAGCPWEAVDLRKQRRICRAADVYRVRAKIPEGTSVRFDVVAILGDTLRHFENAFPYHPPGGGAYR